MTAEDVDTVCCGCYPDVYAHNDPRYNLVKEQVSFSYLRAIASYLGSELTIHGPLLDNDGVDLTLRTPQERFLGHRNTKPSIDVQMKCTSCPDYDAGMEHLRFRLDRSLYDRLSEPGMCPTLLMVLVLPEDVENWVYVSDEGLKIPREMLWYSTSGAEAAPSEDAGDRVTIRIPRRNRVTPESVHGMLLKVADMEDIVNEA